MDFGACWCYPARWDIRMICCSPFRAMCKSDSLPKEDDIACFNAEAAKPSAILQKFWGPLGWWIWIWTRLRDGYDSQVSPKKSTVNGKHDWHIPSLQQLTGLSGLNIMNPCWDQQWDCYSQHMYNKLCVCVCMYVCMNECMYVCMYVCNVCMYVCMYIYVHIIPMF